MIKVCNQSYRIQFSRACVASSPLARVVITTPPIYIYRQNNPFIQCNSGTH